MRALCGLAVFAITICSAAVHDGSGPVPLTVVVDFEQERYDAEVARTMKAETASLLRDSGVDIQWSTVAQSTETPDLAEMVVFRMRGRCVMDSFPLVADELALPLAFTHASDGEILSFGAVDCDRVRSSLKRTMAGADYARGNSIFGRALGRVMAHELYHMLARTKGHAGEGVTRECLSSRELIRDRLILSEKSLQAIRQQMALLKKRDGVLRPAPDRPIPSATSLP